MERRKFIKNTLLTSARVITMPYLNKLYATDMVDDFQAGFFDPPDNARPWCFYMWMNGNITKEGITLDLEAMKRMGIGGFINFNSAVGIPRGPVDYAGDAWTAMVVHEAAEATRLGLDMFMHNSPGYSGCGGPWISPEFSMQQLVWTETFVNSKGGNIAIKLSKPYAKQNYYRDIYTLAYPSLPVEKALMKDKLTGARVNGQVIDKSIIVDGDPETKVRIEVEKIGSLKCSLLLEFDEPFEARAISILRKPEVPLDLFDGPRDHPPVFFLEASGDGENFRPIGNIACVELRAMDTPSTLSFEPVTAKYYRLTATTATWISEVQLHNGPRLGGWAGKTNQTHGNGAGATPTVEDSLVINPQTVINISGQMDIDGNLNWDAPAGNWTILRMGHTTTGEENAAHPDTGNGLENDKYSKAALDLHFEKFLDPLLEKIKPHIGKGFKGITVDSWEAGKSNWTLKFPEAFKDTSGYDIMHWMPAMTGRILGSVEETERFLWDVRKTQADLLAENFYGYFQQNCHKRGLQFNAEPYGDGVFDSLQVGQHLDTPMSEFWTRYIYGSDVTSKQAASIAHIYGRQVAAAEAFTAMPLNSKWVDYPYSLKAEGDYFFTLGINRLVFHTFVHQPYQTGRPGMTMGPFGSHFDCNNTWTDQAYGWTEYLKRTQALLQQGLFIADACYFKGDEPVSGIPDTYDFMPAGYIADVIGADAFKRFTIKNSKIILPDGMCYRVCILAKLKSILPQTLASLKKLVSEGMILIVSSRPFQAFGKQMSDQVIITSVNELYGNLDGISVKEHVYGKGKVIWNEDIKQVFSLLSIPPDFTYTAQNPDAAIHYIHKKLNGTEYYFVSNHRRRNEKVTASFRITNMQPEIWNSETKEIYNAAVFEYKDGYTHVALEFEPAGSLFIVFRQANTQPGYTSILKDGSTYLSLQPSTTINKSPFTDVQNDFTISVWAKPDAYAQDGKSMVFHAPPGNQLYGKGHAAMAIGAGQNGVKVYERTNGKSRAVLSCNSPLSGWTHIVVVYQNGTPRVYLNGILNVSGKTSANIVHPGLQARVEQDQFSTYFEGNYTEPQLIKEVLSDYTISKLYRAGLPAPDQPMAISLKKKGRRTEILVLKNGEYSIKGTGLSKQFKISGCRTSVLSGAWDLNFPDHPELKDGLILPELISLHNHADFDVKHFSGKVVYQKNFIAPEIDVPNGQQLLLDLGRVEVIAEVKVNGKMLGNLWKAPYQLNITSSLKQGVNNLEISVITLWPNRLIGDEYLLPENNYNKAGFIEQLPDWFVKNQPKPGNRKAFAVWKNFDKTSPLLASGLLGPVTLNTIIKKVI